MKINELLETTIHKPVIKLIYNTPIYVAIKAIRKCWESQDKSDSYEGILGPNDTKLIKRILSAKHESTLEHIVYTFDINGITRACLQEVVRHRIASYSVASTRYVLKKMKKKDVQSIFRKTGNESIDHRIEKTLLKLNYYDNVPNDILKYILPEATLTELVMTINARSLRNFLLLRLDKAALPEIRILAHYMYKNLPEEHLILFEDIKERFYSE